MRHLSYILNDIHDFHPWVFQIKKSSVLRLLQNSLYIKLFTELNR